MSVSFEKKLEKTAKRLGIDVEKIPRHIAIIMDGNGRWAQKKGLPRVNGHRQGGKIVESIALHCVKLGIEVLTLYSFSIENWSRPKHEVDALMYLYTRYLVGIRQVLMKNNVQLVHLGQIDRLPSELQDELSKTMEMTSGNSGMKLALALNYGGRVELVEAVKKIAQKYKDAEISLEDIDDTCISNHLYTAGLKDPELLIRTSNELRISNFLLWQIAYSEFYATETYWPDFKEQDLEKAILAYSKRTRRFGNVNVNSE